MDKNTEFSVELNPEHIERNSKIFDLGFNRISLGVQTTDTGILKRINREYNAEMLSGNIKILKDKGVNLSLDFMFGLPGQDIKKLKKDIDFIKDKKPEHVSFYLFTLPKNHEMAGECASDDLVYEMFKVIHNELTALGYDHYEVSNYAVKGKGCKHNMAYWERKSYLGIGAAAHSFIKEEKLRRWHPKDVDSYIADPISCEGQESLDNKMEYDENIMLGLRLLNIGVDVAPVKDKNYLPLVEKGLLKIKSGKLLVTETGITLLDYITSELTRD
ncbi:MAG: radical SAM protein [Proteobacteria bacterium]|nr:radical SAM protein [Pseudomonadota bacterium]